MLRIVLDSSAWVRGIISRTGAAGFIIQAWRQEQLEVVVSRAIANETFEVLRRPHIQRRRHLTEREKKRAIVVMVKHGILVEGTLPIDAVPADLDDNAIIAAAVEGNAQYIVSEDDHLKSLKVYQGIQMIDPADFANLLRQELSKGPSDE